MLLTPHRNKLIWNPDELKLLVERTIAKIVACPFKQGRSFLHHIVANVLEQDEEVKASVRHKNIVSYESLRDCGFIPAFQKAWTKLHETPGITVNVVGGAMCQASTMPLHKLLEIARTRIEQEFEPMATKPGLGREAALALMPQLSGLIDKKLTKETIAVVVSPGRFGTAVADLQRKVGDVIDIDLVTEKDTPSIRLDKTTQMVMLEKDPVATIHQIGARLARSLKKTEVEVVKRPNWRACQDHIIEYAAGIRRSLKMV